MPLSLPLLGPLTFPFLIVASELFLLQTLMLVFLVAVIPEVEKEDKTFHEKKKKKNTLSKHATVRNKKEITCQIFQGLNYLY